jgi:hypothetical protein
VATTNVVASSPWWSTSSLPRTIPPSRAPVRNLMKTFTMVLLAASRTAAAAFAPRSGLAFAPSAATRAYSRSATVLAAGNPKGTILTYPSDIAGKPFAILTKLPLLYCSFAVFFDMEIGGTDAGRIEFELRADGPSLRVARSFDKSCAVWRPMNSY